MCRKCSGSSFKTSEFYSLAHSQLYTTSPFHVTKLPFEACKVVQWSSKKKRSKAAFHISLQSHHNANALKGVIHQTRKALGSSKKFSSCTTSKGKRESILKCYFFPSKCRFRKGFVEKINGHGNSQNFTGFQNTLAQSHTVLKMGMMIMFPNDIQAWERI